MPPQCCRAPASSRSATMGKKKAPSKQTQMLQILVALREGNVDAIKGHIAKGMDVNAPLLGAGTEPVLVVCEESLPGS